MATNTLTFPQPKCAALKEEIDEAQLVQLLKRPDIVKALDARAIRDARCNQQTTTLFNRLQALHRKKETTATNMHLANAVHQGDSTLKVRAYRTSHALCDRSFVLQLSVISTW